MQVLTVYALRHRARVVPSAGESLRWQSVTRLQYDADMFVIPVESVNGLTWLIGSAKDALPNLSKTDE